MVKFDFASSGCPIFPPSTLLPPSMPMPPPSTPRHRRRLPRRLRCLPQHRVVAVAVTNPIAPSPTSSPTPSLRTACTRCVILLPSRPPSRGSKSGSRLGRACKAGRPAGSISPPGSLEARRARWYSSSRLERVEATSTCSCQCELPLQCDL
jgi:hypothetical protein